MISYRCKSGRATAFTSFLRSCCLPHLHRSPVRKTGSFLTALPCGGFNSRAFYAELSGDMRISALKVRVLCSAPSRQEGEEAREVKHRAPCTNWAHKFADGKTMADDKTQLGRHIWWHTVIFGAPIPRQFGSTPTCTPISSFPLVVGGYSVVG